MSYWGAGFATGIGVGFVGVNQLAEECCGSNGCGCQTTTIYTSEDCHVCGRRLRVTGSMQRIKLYLTCFDCGYRSSELSLEQVRELLD